MNLKQQLDHITGNNHIHGLFLQHLSALERSGHQKLLRFKIHWNIKEEEFLIHLADEARHAAHLRKLALSLTEEKEKVGIPTKNYLTKLEIFLLRELRRYEIAHPKACYVLLTYVIERRAERLYPRYEEFLSQKGGELSVRSIIEDEATHLELMKEEIANLNVPKSLLDAAVEFEEKLFSNFMEQFKPDAYITLPN